MSRPLATPNSNKELGERVLKEGFWREEEKEGYSPSFLVASALTAQTTMDHSSILIPTGPG